MTIRANAAASPEKRLFISLITRDISLRDAIIDLTDNSVNAAMRPLQSAFASSKDFVDYLAKGKAHSAVKIVVTYDKTHITVEDDAEGIEFAAARDDVFRFGHSEDYKGSRDRLSVYGIGMKRALFKIGNRVLACTRFRRHRVRCFNGTGGWSWRDGSLPGSSSLRRCG